MRTHSENVLCRLLDGKRRSVGKIHKQDTDTCSDLESQQKKTETNDNVSYGVSDEIIRLSGISSYY